MSLTQVYTETRDGRNASTRSISLRGRSPNPPPNIGSNRGSFDKGGDLELAQLGATKDAVSASPSIGGGESPPVGPAEPAKVSQWTGRIQFLTLCFTLFLAGWNDGTTGPLLPVMQIHYHVSCGAG